MTISFKSDDSLYKIFSTLKKLPPYKKVTVTFPDRHEIFNHPWWAKQLKEMINEYHLDVSFLVNSREHSHFLQGMGLSVIYEKPHTRITRIFSNLLGILRGDTPGSHKKIVSSLIIIAELSIFILLLSFFWGVISPKATISFEPNARIRPVTYRYLIYPTHSGSTNLSTYTNPDTLPYEKNIVEYETSLSVDIADITYSSTPAQGSITITNTLPTPYSLLQGTQFITNEGLLFRSDTSIEIPAGSVEEPSIVTATVSSSEKSELGSFQGENANIRAGTRLTIRNLSESRVMQGIWAESNEDFVGGSVDASGVVSADDIQSLKEKLIQTMDLNKKTYLNMATQDDTEYFNLPFDQFITFTPLRFETDAQQGDELIQIEGTVTGELLYHRVSWSDLTRLITTYLSQRPLEGYSLIDTDRGSLRTYDLIDTPITGQWYMPTKLNTIWGYDFATDSNELVYEITQRIAGLSRDEAMKIILSYEQIRTADITISPFWYDVLPENPGRISVQNK